MTRDGATVNPDGPALAALVDFARVELESRDVEPWADLFAWLHTSGHLDLEAALWIVALYNTHDSLASAFQAQAWWPGPYAWADDDADGRARANLLECTQERRNLRGGKVVRRHASYVDALAGQTQGAWLRSGLAGADSADNFRSLTAWLRQVWGVGRQSAFEWAEFAGKVAGLPVDAGDAQLWESEGPRRSLQRLYGNPNPTPQWLDARAHDCKQMLENAGIAMAWWDFETIICDFNVMRDGRYYPGRHLAAVRAEIDECPPAARAVLLEGWHAVVPPAWASIEPGIVKAKLPLFRDSGQLLTTP